jgi:hypothetical protein
MEAQRFAGRSTRAARASQRSANQRGKPIVHGRKALNLRRDKRRIEKLERELDGGRQSRQKLEENWKICRDLLLPLNLKLQRLEPHQRRKQE